MDSDQEKFKFENISNFRDVARTVNTFLGQRLMKEGLLYRSARPDDATAEDLALIRDELGLRTVMDLRSKAELINASNKRRASLRALPVAESNNALAEAPQIPGVRYLGIKLGSRNVQRWMLWQLSWWNIFLVLIFYLLGLRMQVIGIMAREVMGPRGLTGLVIAMVDYATSDINEALSAFLDPGAMPMLVHCTQGKDRTGLVVLFVLMILGVPLAAIEFDYRLTDQALLKNEGAGLDEMRHVGLPDEFRRTAPDLVHKVHRHLQDAFGGLEQYLDTIGFDRAKRDRLRQILLY